MVLIDTDVFILEFAFHRDRRYETNVAFLTAIRQREPAITIYNLMEILGQLSFNLDASRLGDWRLWLQEAYSLTILWPAPEEQVAREFFHHEIYTRPLVKMQAVRMAFMDGLIIGLVERAPDVEAFVTWNARHFRDKTHLLVLTPGEYLEGLSHEP